MEARLTLNQDYLQKQRIQPGKYINMLNIQLYSDTDMYCMGSVCFQWNVNKLRDPYSQSWGNTLQM